MVKMSNKKDKTVARRRGRKSEGRNEQQSKKQSQSSNVILPSKERQLQPKDEKGGRGVIQAGAIAVPSYQPHASLLILLNEDAPTWYRCGEQQPERNATIVTDPPTATSPTTITSIKGASKTTIIAPALVAKYRALADEIYRREVQLFSEKSGKSSDDRWVESTMKKGTLKDRIAAMSVVISTDPLHKFYALTGLLQMAGCSEFGHQPTNSRVAQLTAEALQDLFLNTFLPSKRKLLTLDQRPLYLYEKESGEPDQTETSKKKKTKHTLSPRILLLWRFEEMVKEKYYMFIRQYLTHTLQEGVEMQKIAAIRCAATLLRSVPEGEEALLQIIVNKLGDPAKKVAAAAAHELRRVLRQHPVMQDVIAREVQQLAHRPRLSSRALYNCITFLNQIKLSRSSDDDTQGNKTSLPASLISTYFGLFELAVQSRKSIQSKETEEDGMKSRLLSALLTGVNRAHPYLPKHDQTMERHIDALYRVVHTAPPAACTQALLLLFHLAVGSTSDGDTDSPGATTALLEVEVARQDRFYRALYSMLSDSALLTSGKHLTMFFNLLYKAMKYDKDMNRVVAFSKRISATTIHASSAVTAASLFLLNEIAKYHPVLLSTFREVVEGDDAVRVLDPSKRDPRWALVVLATTKDKTSDGSSACRVKEEDNSRLRRAPGWELTLTLNHFHPSVRKFANSIGEGNIMYTGDPLKDFALAPFLDKFAYRNPKSGASKFQRGESVAERRTGTESVTKSRFALPVNDQSFLERDDLNPEDEFFHRFFVERSRRDEVKGIVRHKEETDARDEERAEEEALDAAEQDGDADASRFEEYAKEWDSDSDEEAFVDSLAEKIIEDAVGENGPADLDDEDPDMGDWGDLEDEDSSEDENIVPVKSMDDQHDSDSEDGSAEVEIEDDVDAFMDDDDDSSNGSGEEPFEHDTALDADGASSSSEEGVRSQKNKRKNDVFASAQDYEGIIDSHDERNLADDNDDDSNARPASKVSKVKTKKSKKFRVR